MKQIKAKNADNILKFYHEKGKPRKNILGNQENDKKIDQPAFLVCATIDRTIILRLLH